MSYPKSPGDPEAHRALAARHLEVVQERVALRTKLADAADEIARLRADFLRYAAHSVGCRHYAAFPGLNRCSCGLDEAGKRAGGS